MTLSDAFRQELHQHYRDTCGSLAKVNALRERYTLYTVVVLSVILLGVFGQMRSEDIVAIAISNWLGSDVQIGASYLRVVLWFALLAVTLKYFNMNVQHEKLIQYLQEIEDRLNEEFGKDLITREGKFYATNYPPFSKWVWIAYTIIFPALLVLSVVVCMVAEFQAEESWGLVLVLDCILSACVAFSTLLYVLFLHVKN